jgi:hypothetical protein
VSRLGVPRPPKKPADQLTDLAAPREIVEWVRKLPPADAVRTAWIDVPKADWLPYLAILRGFGTDAIVKTTCACLVEMADREASRLEQGAALLGHVAPPTAAPPLASETVMPRLIAILREGADQGPAVLGAAEPMLEDLRLAMIARGDAPGPGEPWLFWAKAVLELSRASRKNPLIGVALVLRMLVDARGRRTNADLIARFRDKLMLGS